MVVIVDSVNKANGAGDTSALLDMSSSSAHNNMQDAVDDNENATSLCEHAECCDYARTQRHTMDDKVDHVLTKHAKDIAIYACRLRYTASR